MKKIPLLCLLYSFFLLLAACGGARNLVVLVPDPDGSVGKVSVFNEQGRVTMETPNQATTIRDQKSTPTPPTVMKKEEIDSIFAKALSLQPAPPVHFILHFESGSDTLVPESKLLLSKVIEAALKQGTPSICVVGHTDTAGNKDYNLALSKRRAQVITGLLIKSGVPADIIETTSHGEENPLIKTGDNVSEPRNRRVEVIVR